MIDLGEERIRRNPLPNSRMGDAWYAGDVIRVESCHSLDLVKRTNGLESEEGEIRWRDGEIQEGL